MPRVKKDLLKLLKALSPREIAQLQAKLVAPKVAVLLRQKAKLERQLRKIDREIARVKGAKLRRVRRQRKAKRVARKAKAPAQPKKAGRVRRGTIGFRIQKILGAVSKPMRVRDICAALVRRGLPKKKGLVSYVNRMLSTNATFAKAGWGQYTLASRLAAAPVKKVGRRKAAKKVPAPAAP